MEKDSPTSGNSSFEEAKRLAEVMQQNVEETGDIDRLSPVERLEMSRGEFETIVNEMAEDIKAEKWDSIIADDVSGRIPGLLLWEVMKTYAKQHDRKAPRIFFVAGGRGGLVSNEDESDDSYPAVVEHLRDISQQLGKRSLIVTEFSDTGESLYALGEAVQESGHNFDIAVIFEDSHVHHQIEEGDLLHDGDVAWYGGGADQWELNPLFAHRKFHPALRDAIGVEKYGSEPTSRGTYVNTPAVNKIRGVIQDMAQNIYQSVFDKTA